MTDGTIFTYEIYYVKMNARRFNFSKYLQRCMSGTDTACIFVHIQRHV